MIEYFKFKTKNNYDRFTTLKCSDKLVLIKFNLNYFVIGYVVNSLTA